LVKVGKAIKPATSEVSGNIRSRSAVMRIAVRVA
jgi:16S rRNA C1402 N4-methylase RsmH